MTEQIMVYANSAMVDSEKDGISVILTGVEVGQVIQEFTPEEILEALTAADHYQNIVDYISKKE